MGVLGTGGGLEGVAVGLVREGGGRGGGTQWPDGNSHPPPSLSLAAPPPKDDAYKPPGNWSVQDKLPPKSDRAPLEPYSAANCDFCAKARNINTMHYNYRQRLRVGGPDSLGWNQDMTTLRHPVNWMSSMWSKHRQARGFGEGALGGDNGLVRGRE